MLVAGTQYNAYVWNILFFNKLQFDLGEGLWQMFP